MSADYSTQLERLRLNRSTWPGLNPREDAATDPTRYVGRVTSIAPAVDQFILVQPQILLGTEAEGGTGTFTDLPVSPRPALLLGPGVPSTGDRVIVRAVGHRWIARKGGPGAPTGPCTWNITVNGCTGPRAGVLVTVTLGSGTYSAITNGSGIATFPSLPTGSATATASPPNSRFLPKSLTQTLVSGTQSGTIGLLLASGYVCCAGCLEPIAKTLYATDAFGTWPLVWDSIDSWRICYTASGAGATRAEVPLGCDPCVFGSVTFGRSYRLTCASTGIFTLVPQNSTTPCPVDTLTYMSPGGCSGTTATVSSGCYIVQNIGFATAADCPIPLNLTFVFAHGATLGFDIGTVTVTE